MSPGDPSPPPLPAGASAGGRTHPSPADLLSLTQRSDLFLRAISQSGKLLLLSPLIFVRQGWCLAGRGVEEMTARFAAGSCRCRLFRSGPSFGSLEPAYKSADMIPLPSSTRRPQNSFCFHTPSHPTDLGRRPLVVPNPFPKSFEHLCLPTRTPSPAFPALDTPASRRPPTVHGEQDEGRPPSIDDSVNARSTPGGSPPPPPPPPR